MTTWISGTKPLTEPVLAYHINCSATFKWEQIHKTVLWNSSVICVRRKWLPYLPGTSKLIIAAFANRVCLSWFQPMYRVSGADGIWQWTASLLRFPRCLLPTKAINVVAAVDWYLTNSINLPRKLRFLIIARCFVSCIVYIIMKSLSTNIIDIYCAQYLKGPSPSLYYTRKTGVSPKYTYYSVVRQSWPSSLVLLWVNFNPSMAK